jgi:hypothetical protein
MGIPVEGFAIAKSTIVAMQPQSLSLNRFKLLILSLFLDIIESIHHEGKIL